MYYPVEMIARDGVLCQQHFMTWSNIFLVCLSTGAMAFKFDMKVVDNLYR